MIAPVAPTGWPSEMPLPLGFTFSGSKPSSCATAHAWAANASFDSITSMSEMLSPARLSAIGTALAGPMPMMLGSTPAWPQARMRAIGFRPFSFTAVRSEEHTSELQSLMRISYAVFCLKKKKTKEVLKKKPNTNNTHTIRKQGADEHAQPLADLNRKYIHN